jgi:methylglutaconyl-CoA hydratase
MSDRFVRHAFEGRVSRVELTRPEAENRITSTMMKQFIGALSEATDFEADVLLITAAGSDFSVGRDQQEKLPEGMTRADGGKLIVEANRLVASFPGIIVTSVRGRALGFGCGVVLQSDLSVVADTAVLGFDEIRHGIAPAFVMSYVQDYVGPKRALDLILTGRTLTAHEAERIGMVSRVVAADALEANTDSLVAGLLRSDRRLLTTCKSYLRGVQSVPPEQRSERALATLFGSPAR